MIDVLYVIGINGKEDTRYNNIFEINPECVSNLRICGEAGTVNINTDTTPKVAYQGL